MKKWWRHTVSGHSAGTSVSPLVWPGIAILGHTSVRIFVHEAWIGYLFFPGRTCADGSTSLSWEKNLRTVGGKLALAVTER